MNTDQYNLYGGTPPHSDFDTSKAAALSVAESGATMRDRVLRCIRESRIGRTDEEVERLTGLRHQTASARRRELFLLGAIIHRDEYRQTTSGRRAKVWRAAP